jgi:hypothetical protein
VRAGHGTGRFGVQRVVVLFEPSGLGAMYRTSRVSEETRGEETLATGVQVFVHSRVKVLVHLKDGAPSKWK